MGQVVHELEAAWVQQSREIKNLLMLAVQVWLQAWQPKFWANAMGLSSLCHGLAGKSACELVVGDCAFDAPATNKVFCMI